MGKHNPTSSFYEFGSIKINELIKDILKVRNRKIKHFGVGLLFDCPEDVYEIKGQAGNLGQVILSFIDNALESFTVEQDKWIKISISKAHGIVYIRFTDNGNSEENVFKDNILEPFSMIHGAGNGEELGLSLCQTIINEHYGQVYLNEVGEHTEFVIELPVNLEKKNINTSMSNFGQEKRDLAWA